MQISDEVVKQILLERERLVVPHLPAQKATGIGIARFIVSCDENVLSVLGLAKEVLSIVNYHSLEEWSSLEIWKERLPYEFVNGCLPELSEQRKIDSQKRWEQLTYEQKIKNAVQEEKWTLSSWLAWLEPEGREWFWWNAVLFDTPLKNSHFVIEVTTLDSSFMAGALQWLFKACGAVSVVAEDDL